MSCNNNNSSNNTVLTLATKLPTTYIAASKRSGSNSSSKRRSGARGQRIFFLLSFPSCVLRETVATSTQIGLTLADSFLKTKVSTLIVKDDSIRKVLNGFLSILWFFVSSQSQFGLTDCRNSLLDPSCCCCCCC